MLIQDPLTDSVKKKATREGYGQGLVELGEKNERIVVLDADLSGSTKTAVFAKKFPERFFNFGVAEQNMVGHAAGLALSGLLPVVSSFAIFLTGRAWEIVRNSVVYPHLNIKLAASHAGITLGEDGASHQIIEDIGLMRSIPTMKILVPADFWQAYHSIHMAIEADGPFYIRLGRSKVPMIYSREDVSASQKVYIIQEGGEIAFFSTGVMVYESWKAAKILEQKFNLKIWVVNIFSIKPLDIDPILMIAKRVKKIYTFEEHNVQTGFGSAIAELLSEKHPLTIKRIGIQDKFGQSGSAEGLMSHYNLSADKLVHYLEKDLFPKKK